MWSVGVKNGMGVQRNEIGPINISSVCSASDYPTNVGFKEICRISSHFV